MAQLQALNAKVFLSVVTIGELRRGIEAIRHRRDFAQAQLLEAWFNDLVQVYAEHILLIDSDIAQLWGHLRVPNPHNELDKLIAATALIYIWSDRRYSEYCGFQRYWREAAQSI